MRLLIQIEEDVIFQTEDFVAVPSVGEEIMVEGRWYKVVERHFYFKHLQNLEDNSITLFVE